MRRGCGWMRRGCGWMGRGCGWMERGCGRPDGGTDGWMIQAGHRWTAAMRTCAHPRLQRLAYLQQAPWQIQGAFMDS
eukprot:69778-Chlamydomonas_euryale.AAC.1